MISLHFLEDVMTLERFHSSFALDISSFWTFMFFVSFGCCFALIFWICKVGEHVVASLGLNGAGLNVHQ